MFLEFCDVLRCSRGWEPHENHRQFFFDRDAQNQFRAVVGLSRKSLPSHSNWPPEPSPISTMSSTNKAGGSGKLTMTDAVCLVSFFYFDWLLNSWFCFFLLRFDDLKIIMIICSSWFKIAGNRERPHPCNGYGGMRPPWQPVRLQLQSISPRKGSVDRVPRWVNHFFIILFYFSQ